MNKPWNHPKLFDGQAIYPDRVFGKNVYFHHDGEKPGTFCLPRKRWDGLEDATPVEAREVLNRLAGFDVSVAKKFNCLKSYATGLRDGRVTFVYSASCCLGSMTEKRWAALPNWPKEETSEDTALLAERMADFMQALLEQLPVADFRRTIRCSKKVDRSDRLFRNLAEELVKELLAPAKE